MGNDRWGRGGEGGGREMKTAYLTRVFWSTAACYQGFLYWKYHKKEWSSTEQASNETLAKKNPRGTFLQIQTDIYVYSSFSFSGAVRWNSLPIELRQANSLRVFRIYLNGTYETQALVYVHVGF